MVLGEPDAAVEGVVGAGYVVFLEQDVDYDYHLIRFAKDLIFLIIQCYNVYVYTADNECLYLQHVLNIQIVIVVHTD